METKMNYLNFDELFYEMKKFEKNTAAKYLFARRTLKKDTYSGFQPNGYFLIALSDILEKRDDDLKIGYKINNETFFCDIPMDKLNEFMR